MFIDRRIFPSCGTISTCAYQRASTVSYYIILLKDLAKAVKGRDIGDREIMLQLFIVGVSIG